MITVSLSEEKDAASIKEFSAREWPNADKEHFGDQVLDFAKPQFKLIAWDGEKIAGYISLILDMGVLHMESLIVGEHYRGQGVARQLVEAAEEKGRLMGAHKMWLETGSDWKAKDVYEKLGYQVRAHLNNYYANRDFVLMDKDL